MAAPSAPTLISIAQEGLNKANAPNKLQRAMDEWIEELKNRVWSRGKKLKFLQTEGVITVNTGQSRYSMPSDLSSIMSVVLLYGATTGTAQAGAAGTITLAAADTSDDSIVGKELIITSGTGLEQKAVQITAFNSTTKVATVNPNFTTTPDNTSVYMIVTETTKLDEAPVWDFDKAPDAMGRAKPSCYSPIGDDDNGEIMLYVAPDQLYGLKIRYYADLMELDLTGTLIATLYKRWRNYLVQGVYVAALEENDDRASLRKLPNAKFELEKLFQELLAKEKYGADLSNLQITIED
jgi:hypothetical protein